MSSTIDAVNDVCKIVEESKVTAASSLPSFSLESVDSLCKLYLSNLNDIKAGQFMIIQCRDGDIKTVLDQHTARFSRFAKVTTGQGVRVKSLGTIQQFIDFSASDIHLFLNHLKHGYSIDDKIYTLLATEFQVDQEKQRLIDAFITSWTLWMENYINNDSITLNYLANNASFRIIPLTRLLSTIISKIRKMPTLSDAHRGNLVTINLRYSEDDDKFTCIIRNLGAPGGKNVELQADDMSQIDISSTRLLSPEGYTLSTTERYKTPTHNGSIFGAIIIC